MDYAREISSVPERLFVIGDVHGCLAELQILVDHLESKLGLSNRDKVIFLGDYIDRGPYTQGVIEFLLRFRDRHPDALVFLRGNHEDMLLDFLGFQGSLGMVFSRNGGGETLKSYGLSPLATPDEFLAVLPHEHVLFFQSLDRMCLVGDYLIVHAGINPLRSIEGQVNEDIFWIRDEFILHPHHLDKTVVFGHTPFENILFDLPLKIGLDTGAVYGNLLSCLELNEGKVYQVSVQQRRLYEFEMPAIVQARRLRGSVKLPQDTKLDPKKFDS